MASDLELARAVEQALTEMGEAPGCRHLADVEGWLLTDQPQGRKVRRCYYHAGALDSWGNKYVR